MFVLLCVIHLLLPNVLLVKLFVTTDQLLDAGMATTACQKEVHVQWYVIPLLLLNAKKMK